MRLAKFKPAQALVALAAASAALFLPAQPRSEQTRPENKIQCACCRKHPSVFTGRRCFQLCDSGGSFTRVYFARGSATLNTAAKRILDKQAYCLAKLGNRTIVILAGSADRSEVADQHAAVELGVRRAYAVKRYLVRKGRPARTIETIGSGWIGPDSPLPRPTVRRPHRFVMTMFSSRKLPNTKK